MDVVLRCRTMLPVSIGLWVNGFIRNLLKADMILPQFRQVFFFLPLLFSSFFPLIFDK